MVYFIYPNSGTNILKIRQITKTFSNFFSIFQYEAGGWQTFSSNCQSCFTLFACMADHSKGTPLPHMMAIIEIWVFVFDICISCSKQRSIALDSLHIGITVQIHFVGQGDDLLRAGDDAKAASLTTLSIHLDGAFHFCHCICLMH